MNFKVKGPQVKAIRAAAIKASKDPRCAIQVAIRTGPLGESTNALLCSEDGQGTDLHDLIKWAQFMPQGIDLTPEGNGILDLWIYERPRPGTSEDVDLINHLTVTFRNREIAELYHP